MTICTENADKMVDLKMYMVETPIYVHTTYKISKVLNLFRHMQLKILPVIDPHHKTSESPIRGIITRHDLIRYMN